MTAGTERSDHLLPLLAALKWTDCNSAVQKGVGWHWRPSVRGPCGPSSSMSMQGQGADTGLWPAHASCQLSRDHRQSLSVTHVWPGWPVLHRTSISQSIFRCTTHTPHLTAGSKACSSCTPATPFTPSPQKPQAQLPLKVHDTVHECVTVACILPHEGITSSATGA